MTLLAAFDNAEGTYLVSDILYLKTSEEVAHVDQAIFPISGIFTPEFWRSALNPVQKIYIINSSLAVGVADNYFVAKDMVQSLSEAFPDNSSTLADIRDFLVMKFSSSKYPATILGLHYQDDEVTVFRYRTTTGNFEIGTEFFEGTGGPKLEEILLAPAVRRVRQHSTGNRAAPRSPVAILHEVVELVFVQRNNGAHLLDEFGGGFQIIELVNGEFRYVGNIEIIGSHADHTPDKPRFGFEPAIVMQRYVNGRFVVSVCPMRFNDRRIPATLDLITAETKYNVVENWLLKSENINLGQVWHDLSIDFYALVVHTYADAIKWQVLGSYIMPKVDSDYFTFRFEDRKDDVRVIIGSNFVKTLNMAYEQILFHLRDKLPEGALKEVKPILIEFNGVTVEEELIVLDGNYFIGVYFRRCLLIYRGEKMGIERCSAEDCAYRFEQAADNTLNVLRAFYQSGNELRELVDGMVGMIKR